MAGSSIYKSGVDPTTSTQKATWSFWVKFQMQELMVMITFYFQVIQMLTAEFTSKLMVVEI